MAQVQALGRQLAYLNADIITLNEVPNDYVWQLTNFRATLFALVYLATNSATDGFIRSAV